MDERITRVRLTVDQEQPPAPDRFLELVSSAFARYLAAVDSPADVRVHATTNDKEEPRW